MCACVPDFDLDVTVSPHFSATLLRSPAYGDIDEAIIAQTLHSPPSFAVPLIPFGSCWNGCFLFHLIQAIV